MKAPEASRSRIHGRVTRLLVLLFFTLASGFAIAQNATESWRSASEAELKSLLPARAPVEKEHIETELRTASGVTDGHGRFIAGVVLITAGYSADGKYTHFMMTQVPIQVGDFMLAPGEYVLGWQRGDSVLNVHFYEAATGTPSGSVEARPMPPPSRVESFRVWPPQEKSMIQIGRFGIPYRIRK